MNYILNISSKLNLDDLQNCFSSDEIDYIYNEKVVDKRGGKHYFSTISFLPGLYAEDLAQRLVDIIILKYQRPILIKTLKHNFIEFDAYNTNEIIKSAEKSITVFNQIYNKIILVKNLTNYLKSSNNLSIEGFLNFRTTEYRRIIYMVLSDVIERFLIKEEYNTFIDILKQYIDNSVSQIDLIHIKPDKFGNFMLYNFKKERIIFEFDNINPTEIFLTNQDMLMSILISLIPKRIIWHTDLNSQYDNLKSTLANIFGERFSICKGCELCDN